MPCGSCGRNFAADRIQQHMNICGREKKRKVFDVTKMRVQGTEAESFVLGKGGKKKPQISQPVKAVSIKNGNVN